MLNNKYDNGDSSTNTSSDESRPEAKISAQHTPTHNYRCLIDRINDRIRAGSTFFSLEYFPPKTASGAINLTSRLDRMALARPLFCDITWHPASDPGSDKPTSTMTIASMMLNYCGLDTMMHITCCRMSRDEIRTHLDRAREVGLKNVLALRGDPPADVEQWQPPKDGFAHAVDLVRFIRATYGDYFVIAVAGYPTGHPDCPTYEEDLQHLKEKIDAGADFVITQLFFEAEVFLKFVRDCQKIGINCPILPGIMPIQAYQSIMNIVRISKLHMPADLITALAPFKDNDEAVRQYGIVHCTEMCRQLLNSGLVNGLHFYTLNREVATVQILKNLGMWTEHPRRSLPWRMSANHLRCHENVRPIFWSSRPQSYVSRTAVWEEFPNGRWGNSASAAFGELNDYYLFSQLKSKMPKDERLQMWGKELTCEQDVWEVFVCYLSGELTRNNVKVERIPWNDGTLSPETARLTSQLVEINRHGFLTINSQPNINGYPSTDPVVGWGNPGGYIYQKAYLEFFTSRENVEYLKEVLQDYPNSDTDDTNCDELQPIAVTWGIFPGKEVIQPTVVDPCAFKIWKDEAFSLWREQWRSLYDENTKSRQIIQHIIDTYCLINLVDNDYPKDSCLFDVIHKTLALREARSESGSLSNGVVPN
jgi:methylenetetrahydrofolate reductase (NADPH)